jgi:hypothetical protein
LARPVSVIERREQLAQGKIPCAAEDQKVEGVDGL